MYRKSINSILILLVFCTLTAFYSCKKSDSGGSPGANEVWMQNTAFNPSSRTIAKGTTIKWTNKDGMNHTVTSNTSGVFDSGQLGQDQTFSFTFSTIGTFGYFCKNHSGMTGTIIVQ